jgi:phosphatidylethanolamine/phosphatidyl-N-methylethanolamine N-methyltransferase
MDIRAIEKVYRRYAPRYDFYFGALFQPGRRAVIQKMRCRPGDRILEVGVGTGLSFPLYPCDVRVFGVDISQDMLLRARDRLRREGFNHIVGLTRTDAECLCFGDASFDKVVALYVASVAPSPARLVAEMRRVCKPDGEIYIVNHFRHANPLVGGVERLIAPMSRVMGFRPDVCLKQLIEETGLEVVERASVNAFGYWTLLRAKPVRYPH